MGRDAMKQAVGFQARGDLPLPLKAKALRLRVRKSGARHLNKW